VPAYFDADAVGLPASFPYIAGFGDWITGVLAMLTIMAVRRDWSLAILITWVFAVWVFIDNVNAAGQIALLVRDQNQVTALGWLVLTVCVPGLILTATLLIWHLVKCARGLARTTKTGITLNTT